MEQSITTSLSQMATGLREATDFTFPHVRQEKLMVFHVEPGNVLRLSPRITVLSDYRSLFGFV